MWPARGIAVAILALCWTGGAQAKEATPVPWTLQQAIGGPKALTVTASVRARYEAIGNNFRPRARRGEDAVVLRSTLFAHYDTGPIRIGGEVIDARAYDTDLRDTIDTVEVNALELSQAYVGVDAGALFGPGSTSSIDVGRFTLDLGSRRLVARNNFRNTINAFTGIRLQYQDRAKRRLTAFWTMPHLRLPRDKPSVIDNQVVWDRESTDLQLYGGILTMPMALGGSRLDTYAFGLNERDDPRFQTRNRNLYTPGARFYRDPKPRAFDYEAEGVYQFGNIRRGTAVTAPRADVSAFFVHVDLGYQFAGKWKPHVSLEYDLASGDRGGGAYNRFDSLYGGRRMDFGPTDIDGPLGRTNISSPGVRVEVTPNPRLDALLFYRAAWLDSSTDSFANTGVLDATGRSGRFGAHQVDARVRYWLIPKLLRAETGAAWLINGRFLRTAPNANGYGNPIYGYVDVTATF